MQKSFCYKHKHGKHFKFGVLRSNSNGEALQSGWRRTNSSFIIIEILKNPKKLADL